MYKVIIFVTGFILSIFISYKTYRDIHEVNEKLVITKSQILNINNINTLYSVNVLLKRYRGLLQLVNQASNTASLNEFTLIAQEIKKLSTKIDDIKLKNQIKILLATNYKDKQESFFQYSQIINLLNFKIISISNQNKLLTQLSQENSSKIYSLIHYLPEMVENIAIVRGLGSYIITQNSITSQQKYRIIKEMTNFKNHLNKLDNHSEITDNLLPKVEELTLILDAMFKNNFDFNEKIYFQKNSFIISMLNEYYSLTENDIKTFLNSSLKSANASKSIILMQLIIILFLIVILTIYIYKKINAIEEEKRNKNNEAIFLNKLYQSLHNANGVKKKSKISVEILSNYLSSKYASLYIIDYKNKQLHLAATHNILQDELKHILNYNDRMLMDIIQKKEIQTIENVDVKFKTFSTHCTKVISMPLLNDENILIAIAQLYFIENKKLNMQIKKILNIIANNITSSQKNAENKKYFNLINKHVITSSTNKDGIINYSSEAFCNISQYKKEELIGKSHSLLKNLEMDEKIYKNLWETITKGNTWNGEIANVKKDGTTYWVKATISPEFGFFGDIIGYNSIREDITDKKVIEKISITDSLTNLYNRRYFDDMFTKYINIAKRESNSEVENKFLGFILLDIDHFKQYNDTYGHHRGDIALQKVSRTLKDTFMRPDDCVFRLGGEEFGTLLFASSKEQLCQMATRLIQNVENEKIIHQKNSASEFLTISAGLSVYDSYYMNNTEIMYQESDRLLYKAKENGRNQVYCSESGV